MHIKYFQLKKTKSGDSYYLNKKTDLVVPTVVKSVQEARDISERIRLHELKQQIEQVEGKIKLQHVIHEYQNSHDFNRLSEGTQSNYIQTINQLSRYKFGSKLLIEHGVLNYSDVSKLSVRMTDEFGSNRTHSMLKVLRLIYSYGVRAGLVSTNPLSNHKGCVQPPRKTVWTQAEFDTMVDYCDDHLMHGLSDALYLQRYLVQRPSDAIEMSADQIDDGMITFSQKKTGRTLTLPLGGRLGERLESRIEHVRSGNAPSPYLSTTPDGRQWDTKTLRDEFSAVRKSLKMDHLNMQDLRRTGAVALARKGASLVQIRAWTGHKTLQALEAYLPSDVDQLQAASTMNAD